MQPLPVSLSGESHDRGAWRHRAAEWYMPEATAAHTLETSQPKPDLLSEDQTSLPAKGKYPAPPHSSLLVPPKL